MISAVGVVVPARDERHSITNCLLGLSTALRRLPSTVEWSVCVVADRCSDDTAALARAVLDVCPTAMVLDNEHELPIGEVRDLGVRQVRAVLSGHRADRVWLLSTDADSVVAPDWVTRHLLPADAGVDAVAGVVELDGYRALPPLVSARYRAVVDQARRPEGHGNVYAANLGVRAAAYLAVGGFGAVSVGEDHDLWRRLGDAGYRRHYDEDAIVVTSARRHGRARGGLADLIGALHRDGTPERTLHGVATVPPPAIPAQ